MVQMALFPITGLGGFPILPQKHSDNYLVTHMDIHRNTGVKLIIHFYIKILVGGHFNLVAVLLISSE